MESCRGRGVPKRTPEAGSRRVVRATGPHHLMTPVARRWAGGWRPGRLDGCIFRAAHVRGVAELLEPTARQPFRTGAEQHAQVRRFDRLAEPLPWPNSTLVRGDVADAWAGSGSNRGAGDHGQRAADRFADGCRPDRRVLADDPPGGARQRTAAVPENAGTSLRLTDSASSATAW